MTTFRRLLEFLAESAKTPTAQGKRFKDFCEAFLQIDPIWPARIDAVCSWHDWPDRLVGLPDTGIGLAAREGGSDNIVAVQCKFDAPMASCWQRASTLVVIPSQVEG